MTLFEQFIRRPVATTMLNTSLLVFGILGLMQLPVRELPDIDPPIITVLTVFPGASAEVVETEVTERLEEAISSVEGIKLLTSESREQVSSITVEFIQNRDIDVAAQDVRDQVARIRGNLPDDIEEPIVAKQDSNARPIMWVSFFSDRYDTRELTRIADTMVKDRLQTVEGVSSVIIGGEKRFAVRIWIDPGKMAARGVTVLDVERAIREQNVELPSGRVENRQREFTIQTQGQFPTADAFNRLIIRQNGADVVRLEDIGYARDGVEDERSIARFNSQPAVGLGIVRQSKANTLAVAAGVKARMDEIAPGLPEGIQYRFPYDESIFVSRAVTEVWQTLGIAFVLVVLTIFVFLRNFRSTLIPAISIPLSIMSTFGVLYVMGFSVNIFTLLALVLAIGIVVDDTIVVLENIYRHLEEGMEPYAASVKAMKEIAFAIITTTLSLVSVFLPLAFIGGVTGRLLLEFAFALAGAVIISSIVALTLSPMAGARVLKPLHLVQHGPLFLFFERGLNAMNRRYERMLGWSLRHRIAMIMIALASVGISLYFFHNLEREFLPEEDKGRLLVFSIYPTGSTPEYSDRMMQQQEAILRDTPGVQTYFSAVALPFNGPGDPTFGFMFIRLESEGRPHIRDMVGGPFGLGARLITEVEGAIAIPIMPKAVDIGFSQPFQLVISHPDLQRLNDQVQALQGALWQGGFLGNVRSTFNLEKPEFRVVIDRERAGALQVSVQEIARTLQLLFGGQQVGDFKQEGKQYDVIVQLERDKRLTPGDLEEIYVRGVDGALIQLANVVRLEEGAGPNAIERFQRQRSATIEGTPLGVPLGAAMERTEAILRETLPEGFTFDWKGEGRNLRESSADIYGFMLLAILVVYMVLAAQFESFIHPFTVLLALPLAFLGAFGLLYVLSWVNFAGQQMYGWANFAPDPPAIAGILSSIIPRISSMNMNIFSQVGLILLIGLVTKNSILLVEFANQQMAKGLDSRAAMMRAGILRLRPILMTSLATIAGILPIAIGFGDAAESRRPLGVVAVGGMITSTLLTLFVIPVIYTLFSDLSLKITGRPAGIHKGSVLDQELQADDPETVKEGSHV
ncbi:MAG TPA: efflux RND transporter permease subunit [Kiritimatiellia bacterium]|nr:efflux RND transporter permease subunit [Kiritimatiellia bacterium]HMP97721.1 efflux RND transporter permease subunit [Kiritimatiellia bacterium]